MRGCLIHLSPDPLEQLRVNYKQHSKDSGINLYKNGTGGKNDLCSFRRMSLAEKRCQAENYHNQVR